MCCDGKDGYCTFRVHVYLNERTCVIPSPGDNKMKVKCSREGMKCISEKCTSSFVHTATIFFGWPLHVIEVYFTYQSCVTEMLFLARHYDVMAYKTLPVLLALCEENPPVTGVFPLQNASRADFEFLST